MQTSRKPPGGHALPLGFALFHAGLVAQHRRTLFGYAWLLLPASAAAITAGYVRSRGLIHYPGSALPYPAFVFAGTVLWQVFVETLNAPLTQLAANRALFTKLRFPHEALILAGLWQALLNAAIRLLALIGLCLALGVPLAPGAMLMPLGVICLALLGLGFGLLLAPVGMLYDDVGKGIAVLTGLLFFYMPIAYPLSGDGWQALNPLLPVINSARSCLTGTIALQALLLPALLGAAVLAIAWPLYRLAQPHVLERLG